VSDRRHPQTRAQLARQAAQEQAARREPFKSVPLTAASTTSATSSGNPPLLYTKFCAQCHGESGEGKRQGPFRFPPLLGVSAKPRRTADDVVALLKDPEAYGLQRPMTSFAGKLSEEQMREIAAWVVKLNK
jgi:mono/diheme cytochrome c family protein